jgi:hypothetical protein
MIGPVIFILIELAILFVTARIMFKNSMAFLVSLNAMIVKPYYLFFKSKYYQDCHEKSLEFARYIIVVVGLSILNFIAYRIIFFSHFSPLLYKIV